MNTPNADDGSVPFDEMTDEQAVKWSLQVVCSVRRDPARYLMQKITPFVSAADLMCGPPPSRWRVFARRRWFDRLYERVHREMIQQRYFARAILTLADGGPR